MLGQLRVEEQQKRNGTWHIKGPLPLFEKSRVVIPVAGYFISSHRDSHPTPLTPGWETLMGLTGKIGPTAEKHYIEAV